MSRKQCKILSKCIKRTTFSKRTIWSIKVGSVEQGKILDVAVDIRKDSENYGKYFSYVLSSENMSLLFIPKGFAHGYLTISESAINNYQLIIIIILRLRKVLLMMMIF